MSRWRCVFPGSRWDVPTARNDLPLHSLFKGIGLGSKPRTVHGMAIRLCRGRQRHQSASFGTDDGAIRDRQKSFRERDNASSVDEQPKSPRDARASVSERFDIIRDHTTNHTTTSTPNNTSLTQGFSVERHWSLSDKPKRARMRESPLQIHTQGQSCCVSEHFLSTRGEMQTKGLPVSRHDHHDHGTARTPFAPWPKRSCKMELRVESLKLVLLHG